MFFTLSGNEVAYNCVCVCVCVCVSVCVGRECSSLFLLEMPIPTSYFNFEMASSACTTTTCHLVLVLHDTMVTLNNLCIEHGCGQYTGLFLQVPLQEADLRYLTFI